MKEKLLHGNLSGIVNISPTILSNFPKSLTSDKLNKIANKTSTLQEYPSWFHEHIFLSWDFYPNPDKSEVI